MELPISTYGVSALIFSATFLGLLLFKTLLNQKIPLLKQLHQNSYLALFLLIALGAALHSLNLPDHVTHFTDKLFIIALMVQIGFWLQGAVNYGVTSYARVKAKDQEFPPSHLHLIHLFLQTIVWIVVLLFLLDNLNFDIAALIAGLGIGGVAIALAVQSTLSDLFSSISILLDKPFVLGDMIQIDKFMGYVEKIGIKTTHVRSVNGELIIFSNTDLLKSRIRNFEAMRERRSEAEISLPISTPEEIVSELPKKIAELFEEIPKARLLDANISQFSKENYKFTIIYYIQERREDRFRAVKHEVNLKLARLIK